MAGNTNHESTILVTAKLDEARSAEVINNQLKTIKSKLNKVEVDIGVSKATLSKGLGNIKSDIQKQFSTIKLDLGQANIDNLLNEQSVEKARVKLQNLAAEIGKDLGQVEKIRFTNLQNGLVDFEQGTQAVVTYVDKLNNGLTRTTDLVYRMNTLVDENSGGTIQEMSANVSRMIENYSKMDKAKNQREQAYYEELQRTNKKLAEQEKQLQKVAQAEKAVRSNMHSAGQQMYNLPTPTTSTEASATAYSAVVSQYEKIILLQQQYNNSMNGTGKPLSTEQQLQSLKQIDIEYQQLLDLVSQYKSEVTYANKAANSQNQAVAKLQQENQQQSLLNSKIEKAQADIIALSNAWTNIKRNPVLLNELNQLIAKSKELHTSADLTEFNTQLGAFKSKCKAAGVATASWVSGIKDAWTHFSYFFGASRVFYAIIQRTKELYNNVKELDTAMVALKKVTDETSGTYSRFLSDAKQSSKELGASLTDFVNSTADFAKLGYSISDSSELAKVATMYLNVGDDLDGIDDATSTIVSTLKAFNMTASQSESIIDKLNEVSNRFAVSSGDLGQGLANSAAALSTAGNDLNETIALLTAGTEITQNASEMGNSIKVLSMRLRGMKGELEALGEDVDDNVESISKMQTQILNLTHGKVNIFESNGDFKSTYEIMKEISEVYSSLTDPEKAQLLETIAGKQRGNQIAAILTNFSQAEKSLAVSMNSTGSAAKEQAKWMNSIEGRCNQLQSAWESLSTSMLDDKSVKNMIVGLTGLVDALDDIINTIGLFPTVIGALGLGLLIKNINNIKSTIVGVSSALSQVNQVTSLNANGQLFTLDVNGNSTGQLTDVAIMKYQSALEGLSVSQQKAVLSSSGLNQAMQEQILSSNLLENSTKTLSLTDTQLLLSTANISEEEYANILAFTQGKLAVDGLTDGTRQLSLTNLMLLKEQGLLSEATYKQVEAYLVQKNTMSKLSGAGVSLKAMFQSVGTWIGIATMAITAGIAIWNAYDQAQQKIYQDTIQKAQKSASSIEKVYQAWDSYASLDSAATEKEKQSAIDNVNEQLKNKIKLLKDTTDAEKEYADAVKESNSEDFNKAKTDAYTAATKAKEKIKSKWTSDFQRSVVYNDRTNDGDKPEISDQVYGIIKDILGKYATQKYTNAKDIYGNVISGISYGLGVNVDTSNIKSVLDYYDKVQKAIADIESEAEKLGGKQGDKLLSSDVYNRLKSIFADDESKQDDLYDLISDYVDNQANYIISNTESALGLPTSTEEFAKFKESCEKATDSETVQEAVLNRLSELFPKLAQNTEEATTATTAWNYSITSSKVDDKLSSAKDALDDIGKTYKTLSGVVEDYNTNGYLTLENLDSIIDAGDDYISALFNENGQLELNKNAYIKLAKAKIENLKYTQLQSALSDINALSNATEVATTDKLTNSTLKLTEATLTMAAAKKIAEGIDPKKVYGVIDRYSKIITIYDEAENQLENNTDAFFSYTKSTDKATDALEKQKDTLEKNKDALEKQKDALEDAKDSTENGIDSIKDLIDLVQEMIQKNKELEKEGLEKQKKSQDDIIDKYKEQLDLQEEQIKKAKELAEQESDVAKNALSVAITGLDDSSAGKKANKEALDSYKDSKDDLSDTLREDTYNDRIDALDKLKEANDKYYDDKIQLIEDYLGDEVQLYKDACSMIDNDNGQLYSQLSAYVQQYTTTSEAEFNHMWTEAQNALQAYNTDNLSTIDLLNVMQNHIYDLTGQIEIYQTQIDNVSDAIDSVSSSINTIKDNINNNANAITNNAQAVMDYTDKANKLKEALGEAVENGKKFRKLYDSPIGPVQQRNYNNPKPFLYGSPIGFVAGKHASGTKSAKGGLSIVDEEGIGSELIPTSLGNGRYTILPQGNPVFSKAMTNELFEFASAPTDYFAQKFGSEITPNVVNNKSTVVSPAININVQGDATQATVNALHKESEKIMNNTIKKLMSYTVNNRHL